MDGVLIDSGDAHLESWMILARELGAGVSQDEFFATFGRPNRDIIPVLFGRELGEAPTSKRIDELSERKETLYRELVRGRIPPIDGAVNLVRACHAAGLRLAVGSSGHPENIALALDELGLAGLFEVVVDGHDVTRGKPDPQVFLLAAERLGVAPAACAVVEDAPSGIAAARAAGMVAIGLTTHHAPEALVGAHLVVDRLAELTPQGHRVH